MDSSFTNLNCFFTFVIMGSKILTHPLLLLLLCCMTLTQCNQSVQSDELMGTWELASGSKNNVKSSFLDGTWMVITEVGCKSNLFADQYTEQPYALQDSLLKVANGDKYWIRALTDTTMILEIVKSRNLFRLEMMRVESD